MLRGPLSVVRRPPSAVRRPPSAVRRPPSAVRRPSSAVRRPSSAVRPPFIYTLTNTIALCHDRHNLQKYHGCLTLKTAKFHTNSDVYISHNCCCASLLCIFVFCRAVRYSFDHINRVLMEIWVKIKQLISILFCGYRRRMPIHYCRCKPKPILARGTGCPSE